MAYYYDQNIYNLANITYILAHIITGFSLFVYILGIFSYKIIGI